MRNTKATSNLDFHFLLQSKSDVTLAQLAENCSDCAF